ncbi:unnamed protein product [Parnassius apollo]|uniref:(apollo) hypothetical protein n=1 Tax=Parnassius apollo TaxID=110799 RepID=A0A8S3WVY6_PARAO|nr:unnamed protein product [Parnassius apollo]
MNTCNSKLKELSSLCRGCLTDCGEMKNMVQHGLIEDFYKFSDIQVNEMDRLSDLLCVTCEDVLMECRRFRSQCQQSDIILRSNMKNNSTILEQKNNVNGKSNESQNDQMNNVLCTLYDKKLVVMITAPDMNSKIILHCPYQCSEGFLKKPELLNHLVKKHAVESDFLIELQYYCFIEECSYHLNSGKSKYFSGRKFLNQHYNKVHRSKAFSCAVCKFSFTTESAYARHLKTCNYTYECLVCNRVYTTNEKLLVHLMRHHPSYHKQYKNERKAEKRKLKMASEAKKVRVEFERSYICDSPKRSFATQTLKAEENIKNDITLPSWIEKSDGYETKTDEISTQTVFEDLLSLKSQASEDESIYFSENVSLSDIQTQTFPVEFGLSRSNKETITSETQSPDLSIKETQTCFCLYDSPKFNFKLFESVSSSPVMNLTSTETQTADFGSNIDTDMLLGCNTAETQTSFEDYLNKEDL